MVEVKIMVHLPKEFTKNGFLYILVERTPKKAIYSQWLGNDLIGYKVIKIRVRPSQFSKFLNRHIPEQEVYPSTGEWGKFGWTFKTLDRALAKYQELEIRLSEKIRYKTIQKEKPLAGNQEAKLIR